MPGFIALVIRYWKSGSKGMKGERYMDWNQVVDLVMLSNFLRQFDNVFNIVM